MKVFEGPRGGGEFSGRSDSGAAVVTRGCSLCENSRAVHLPTCISCFNKTLLKNGTCLPFLANSLPVASRDEPWEWAGKNIMGEGFSRSQFQLAFSRGRVDSRCVLTTQNSSILFLLKALKLLSGRPTHPQYECICLWKHRLNSWPQIWST